MFAKQVGLLGLGIALAVSGPVTAKTFNAATFLGIDRDADNKASMAEAQEYRVRLFSNLDLDKNGSVEFEEYVQANALRDATAAKDAPVEIPEHYKMEDKNGDTVLSKDEFMEAARTAFAKLDTNKDGFVSRDEFVAPGL
ncbi:MAG: hypothetical protein ABJN51_08420 [Sneathiella sp.]